MKLLFVTPEYLPDSGGGIITFYRFILPELVRQGHEVKVIVADGRHIGDTDRVIEGVQVKYLDPATHGRWLQQFVRYAIVFPWLQEHLALAWAAWETARHGEGWDHVEVTEWPLIFVPWVLHRDRMPCTVQLHGSHGQIAAGEGNGTACPEDEWVRLVECALLKEATAVQTNSQLNARLWTERLGRAVSVENPAFRAGSTGPMGAGSLRRPLVARVFGRFSAGKGAVALAESLARETGLGMTVEWCGRDARHGETTLSATLRQRFPHVMDHALQLRAPIAHDEVLAKMTEGAFVLIPTLSDVFNLTVAEAMAMRAIVVCSKYAGASELIEDGVNGFLFDPLAPADLARALARLDALSAEQVGAMIEHGARTVATRLDPAASVARRLRHYAQVAASPAPPPLSPWLGEAVSGSTAPGQTRALLDRCGLSQLTAAVMRRVPGFKA
jgi:glycosyltransferase involved in cell wall biosynthesis